MKRILFIHVIVLLTSVLYAQESKKYFEVEKPKFTTAIDLSFNEEDFQFGISPGILFPIQQLTLSLNFSMRPFEKKVLIKKSANYYFRYMESRYFLGIGISKRFNFNESLGISFNGGFGHTFGSYSGTDVDADNDWIPLMGFGLDAKLTKYFSVQIGYRIVPIPHVNRNQMTISFIF